MILNVLLMLLSHIIYCRRFRRDTDFINYIFCSSQIWLQIKLLLLLLLLYSETSQLDHLHLLLSWLDLRPKDQRTLFGKQTLIVSAQTH